MKNKSWLVCIVLLAIINVYLFWPGSLYFLNDDLLHIPLTDQGHWFQTNSVRPVHELLVRIDLLLWGKNAPGYHATSLLLYLIVCFQLYDLALIIQIKWLNIERQQAMQAALLAVVLFLAYPQASESIAWIIGRTPILSAIFLLITMRLFFASKIRQTDYLIGAFFFTATLFTYEQSLLLPILLLWLAYIEKQARRTRMFIYAAILIVVDIGYIIVRKLMTSEVVGAYEGGNLLSMNWYSLAANSFRIIFRLVLNPANKTAFIASVIVFLLLTGFLIRAGRQLHINKKAITFFVTATVLLVAPVISLGLAVNSFESGRYLYLPSVFFIIGISAGIVSAFNMDTNLKTPLLALLILLTAYWMWGKYEASRNYSAASLYARNIQQRVQTHFKNSSDTLYIDTLNATVKGVPVFRLGFKTGVNWFNNTIDTNKIVVRNYYDEFSQSNVR